MVIFLCPALYEDKHSELRCELRNRLQKHWQQLKDKEPKQHVGGWKTLRRAVRAVCQSTSSTPSGRASRRSSRSSTSAPASSGSIAACDNHAIDMTGDGQLDEVVVDTTGDGKVDKVVKIVQHTSSEHSSLSATAMADECAFIPLFSTQHPFAYYVAQCPSDLHDGRPFQLFYVRHQPRSPSPAPPRPHAA